MYIKTRTARLYPNSHMTKELDKLCDYRRYCWNLGLETWNEMYDLHLLDKKNNPSPSEHKITLQGNKKHHTRHNEYICYNCGSILDRDENAVANLLDLIN